MPYDVELETRAILKQLPAAHAALAELKGLAYSIPNHEILLNTLAIQEAKDSSAVENIITTHDELFKHPYTKIEFVVRDLGVSRITAANYLNKLAEDGVLRKEKLGAGNYYVNERLFSLLSQKG